MQRKKGHQKINLLNIKLIDLMILLAVGSNQSAKDTLLKNDCIETRVDQIDGLAAAGCDQATKDKATKDRQRKFLL